VEVFLPASTRGSEIKLFFYHMYVNILYFSILLHYSGGEYSVTDDGRVRPKHVLIEFEK
jgi:hypothetical protein